MTPQEIDALKVGFEADTLVAKAVGLHPSKQVRYGTPICTRLDITIRDFAGGDDGDPCSGHEAEFNPSLVWKDAAEALSLFHDRFGYKWTEFCISPAEGPNGVRNWTMTLTGDDGRVFGKADELPLVVCKAILMAYEHEARMGREVPNHFPQLPSLTT